MKYIQKKLFLWCFIFSTICISCNESESDHNIPEDKLVKMKFKNFDDTQIPFLKTFTCDIDDDGIKDFFISSQRIGKTSETSEFHSYFLIGNFHTFTLMDKENSTPLLQIGDRIDNSIYSDLRWLNQNQVTLAEKVIPLNGKNFYQGKWKNASHNFLAFALQKQGKYYYGWVELSFSQKDEMIILHRAAIAEIPDKTVIAGK